MRLNGISNASSVYGLNNPAKVNNRPNFGALKKDAADFLIKKAATLDEKDQITVLNQILRLAQRAKQSFVLDIGFSPLPEAKDFTRLLFIEPGEGGKIHRGAFGDITQIIKSAKTGEVVVITEKLGNNRDLKMRGKKIRTSTPINQFIDETIRAFNLKEAEVVSKKTITESLIEKIMSLTK